MHTLDLEDILRLARTPAPLSAAIIADTEPGVVLLPHPDGKHVLGGPGQLLPGEAWPRLLSPVLSVDLSDLDDPRLPGHGILQIWWDSLAFQRTPVDLVAATHVRWVEDRRALEHVDAPDGVCVSAPVHFEAARLDIPRLPADANDEFYEAFDAIHTRFLQWHLFGYDQPVQGPVLEEIPYWLGEAGERTRSRFTAEEREPSAWRLLAQVGEAGDLVFGDAGVLYVCVLDTDLQRRDFSRAVGIMQCS